MARASARAECSSAARAHWQHGKGIWLTPSLTSVTHRGGSRLFACAVQGLLIEPNLLEFEKIPAKRPNAIAVHAAICSQEQLVHFVGKGAIIPLAENSAGLRRHCLSQTITLRPSHWPAALLMQESEQIPYTGQDIMSWGLCRS